MRQEGLGGAADPTPNTPSPAAGRWGACLRTSVDSQFGSQPQGWVH